MKSTRVLFPLTLLLLVAGHATSQVLDRPVAIVRLTETVNIGQRELRTQVELLEQQLDRDLTIANRREVLDAQVNDVLLNQAAARANVRVTEEEISQAIALQRQSLGQPVSDTQFRRIVEQQMGIGWSEYVEQITQRLVQEKFVLERARDRFEGIQDPSASEIRRVYEENSQQFFNPAMVRFDHLFFDLREVSGEEEQQARRRARDLAARLERNAVTFGELMRNSLDDVTYAGGDFGYLIRGDQAASERLGSEFVDSVFDLSEGEVSGVLESSVGLHIVRITDRRSPRVPDLDDPVFPGERVTVRQQIREFIRAQTQQEIFERTAQEILSELREEAEITLFEQNLDW